MNVPDRKAQSILEYFIVLTVVVSTFVALATSVFKPAVDNSLTNTEQSLQRSFDDLAP